MNWALAGATCLLVIPAELPDKTFISCVVLATRHRPLPVWIGAASALVLQAGVGAGAGRLLALLPHRAVEGVVAALFAGGGLYLLISSERRTELAGEEAAAHGEPEGAVRRSGPARVAVTTFGIVALAETGDLTQIVVANLAARTRDPLSVFAGAAVAFVLVSAVGVAAGKALERVVPLELVRKGAGALLLALGGWSAAVALGA